MLYDYIVLNNCYAKFKIFSCISVDLDQLVSDLEHVVSIYVVGQILKFGLEYEILVLIANAQ